MMNEAKLALKGLDKTELRQMAGKSVRDWARLLARLLSPDDAWRLLLAGCLFVLLPLVGDAGAATVFRELADDLEHGRDSDVLN